MRCVAAGAAAIVLALACAATASAQSSLSDAEIKRALIRESLAAYPGPCPCPYSVKRNGKSCGSYNAYDRPGGRSPLCYERDVTAGMVGEFRGRRGR